MTYHLTQQLAFWRLRVAKEESAFVYFTLEANEGLSFYSTLPHQEGEQKRSIEIFAPVEWKADVDHLLGQVKLTCPQLEVIEEKILRDQKI